MRPFLGERSPALLYILHSGNLYGTERMALATMAALDEYRHRVVFAPEPSGKESVADAAREAGLLALTFRSKWQLVVGLLRWFLRHRRVDVIGTGVSQGLICHALALVTGVGLRQLQVAHGGTEDANSYGRKRHLNRIPMRMIAVSEFVRAKLLEHGVRMDAISVIDNFVSDAQRHRGARRAAYDPALAGARAVDRARVKVAVVSRIDPIKRVDLLLAAVEAQGLLDFEFDVYGSGLDLERLRERARPLQNVRLHGFVADIDARLAASDCLLHLCAEEPFGLVILEAFLVGVVVIVPDAGGAGSLVEDGIDGLRFRAGDVLDLARVLRSFPTLPPARLQAMVDAGRRALDERFSEREGVHRYRQALASMGTT